MSALLHTLPALIHAIGQLRHKHIRRRKVERIARACGASRTRANLIARYF